MADLDELERLARESGLTWSRLSIEWSKVVSASTTGLDTEDNAYIAAASPDVILDLIARVRAAEATAAMLSNEIRRRLLTSGSAMAAHLDVELDTSDVPCLGDYQCRRQTVSPSALACLACIDRHRETTKP